MKLFSRLHMFVQAMYFFVFPVLSENGKERWRVIENEHAWKITTEKGYHKRRRQLFIDEGLSTGKDLVHNTGEEADFQGHSNSNSHANIGPVHQSPITSSGIFAQDIINVNNHFTTKQQCEVEYTRLLGEVDMLRQQIRDVTLKNLASAVIGHVEKEKTIASSESTDTMKFQLHGNITKS